MNSSKRAIPRRRLDQRFSSMKPETRYRPPPKGWVRAVRDALGMSGAQLGRRMGVTAQSVADLEKSEASGTIQLNTLRRVAEALDCVVVYALLPRSSLEDMVQGRAREIARKELVRIAHTMDLEARGLSQEEREEQIETFIRDHLRERDLWEDA
ncbi:MAG: mobile mystery protein A [Alphaproteobacteria bacterium]|nr:mobile mystery protein A [Alphaproteobacteria bacterium]